MKGEIRRELERLDLLARQIKQVEAERDALAMPSAKAVETPAVLLMNLKGVGPETATLLWLRVCSAHSPTDASWPPTPAWHQHLDQRPDPA